MDNVSIQKRKDTKDGCFIMDAENDTESLVSNVDDFNDVEAQEPETTPSIRPTSATSAASIKAKLQIFDLAK